MANTGILQATIAYKTSTDGQPVDVDGNLTSISGKRQAIALLEGYANPMPSVYEVEYYFKAGGLVGGNPTASADFAACPVFYIRTSTDRVVLAPDHLTEEITVFSSNPWTLTPGGNAEVSPVSGGVGATVVLFKKNDTTGDEWYDFTNTASGQVAKVRVINGNSRDWILETGSWNNLGFWYDNGIWNY